eukprot:TRINITY_DN23088_c0_g1_i1.p1 TRINITY_DN23088_c0_g1~~TRINITY_DN23088_c0_g1_i1.p1  ORF type:complete len:220 (-),score=50.38 TRINITY_DN23088_c0_g1_i1:36-695(-)
MLEPMRHFLDKTTIILASASPRRKEILQNLGLTFVVKPSTVDENLEKSKYVGRPFDYTVDTAALKADDVFKTVIKDHESDNLVVIGCDTIVTHGGTIYEKPKDVGDAARILNILSGNSHIVYSGVKLIYKEKGGVKREETFYEATEVEFAELSEEVINGYIATGEPMDKAGGYGIQGRGGSLVRGIKGDYFNVMGFPAHTFSLKLTECLKLMNNSTQTS